MLFQHQICLFNTQPHYLSAVCQLYNLVHWKFILFIKQFSYISQIIFSYRCLICSFSEPLSHLLYKDCGCGGDNNDLKTEDSCVILIDHLQVLLEQIQHIVIAEKLHLPQTNISFSILYSKYVFRNSADILIQNS